MDYRVLMLGGVLLAGCVSNPLFGLLDTEPGTETAEGSTGDPSGEPTTGGGEAVCGDGAVQGGEQCDDADADDHDACVQCMDAQCGDGFVQDGVEACDDGNAVDGDGCDADCAPSSCGDGSVQDGEECDDANSVPDDMCTDLCQLPKCGDGIPQANEMCDDGNDDATDACTAGCQAAKCGDGFVWADMEDCDAGAANGTYNGACNLTCSGEGPKCGDGVKDEPEGCDDGNGDDADGCTNACSLPGCGNGIMDPGEKCDDGNMNNDDGCSSLCVLEVCGDGMVHSGESCDDGNQIDTDNCLSTCESAFCGDGFTWEEMEACDDGNDSNTDGCTNECQHNVCGDGHLHAGVEECDDGNLDNTDECVNTCVPAKCGDGVVRAGVEQCDDANMNPADLCNNMCVKVVPPTCGNGQLNDGEECDGPVGPLGNYANLCDGCTLQGCLRATNTPQEDVVFAGNTWLDECATTDGDFVVIALFNPASQLVYAAAGMKMDNQDWSPDNLTRGDAEPSEEYAVNKHQRLVSQLSFGPKPGLMSKLMLTSQIAAPEGDYNCATSMGDGYGVALFPTTDKPGEVRLLVMGLLGGQTLQPRKMTGFDEAAEIAYAGANPMFVCSNNDPNQPKLAGFNGTFVMAVY